MEFNSRSQQNLETLLELGSDRLMETLRKMEAVIAHNGSLRPIRENHSRNHARILLGADARAIRETLVPADLGNLFQHEKRLSSCLLGENPLNSDD